jgi:hypothetical protein
VFRVGEDISVGIIVDPAALGAIELVRAWMQRSDNLARFVPFPGAAVIAMNAAPRAASGAIGPGWNFTLAAAQSRNLVPGTYGIDAQVIFAEGGEELSEATLLIDLTRAAAP